MADEDPFSVFSDDDDDDSVNELQQDSVASEASRLAKSLIEQANERNTTSSNTESTSNATEPSGSNEAETDLSYLQKLELSWPPPLFLGPILLVSLPVGGGRGYVASRRLEPGTLVMVEEIAMEWPPEQLGQKLGLVSLKFLLRRPDASKLVRDMEEFHPTKDAVDNVTDDDESREQITLMMKTLASEYSDSELDEVLEISKSSNVTSSNGALLNRTDVLRLFLSLRYNGLESGLYRHVAMLNHHCHPNCAKLMPEGQQTYSEVRTTRVVEPGESLTISYVSRIMSHASRRKYLWEQHRFDIGANLRGNELKMELVAYGLPPSHKDRWDEASPTHRIEQAAAELEKMLNDIQDDEREGTLQASSWETLKALEQSSLELYTESKDQLQNENHIILIPILLVHMESCEMVQRAPGLSTAVQLGIKGRQVLTAIRLRALQECNLGNEHFDLARTNLDLANSISELLSLSSKSLLDLGQKSLSNFGQWSSFEQASRREYYRVKSLYPRDLENYLNLKK